MLVTNLKGVSGSENLQGEGKSELDFFPLFLISRSVQCFVQIEPLSVSKLNKYTF